MVIYNDFIVVFDYLVIIVVLVKFVEGWQISCVYLDLEVLLFFQVWWWLFVGVDIVGVLFCLIWRRNVLVWFVIGFVVEIDIIFLGDVGVVFYFVGLVVIIGFVWWVEQYGEGIGVVEYRVGDKFVGIVRQVFC